MRCCLDMYTDEELRSELKRRWRLRIKEANRQEKNRQHWIYWDAVVQSCEDTKIGEVGDRFLFTVSPCNLNVNSDRFVFKLQRRWFKRCNIPQVGDRVQLRYYHHKHGDDYIDESKIIKIIENENS